MMQLASVLVHLNGDIGNTVPKINVTPSECEILRMIHGSDAVTDIYIIGRVDRSSRVERQRLFDIYKKRQVNGQEACPELDTLFPGVAARLYETFAEIEDLDENFFRSEPFRIKEEKQKIELEKETIIYESDFIQVTTEVEEPVKAKATRKKAAEPAPATADVVDDADGFDEMPDNKLFG